MVAALAYADDLIIADGHVECDRTLQGHAVLDQDRRPADAIEGVLLDQSLARADQQPMAAMPDKGVAADDEPGVG